MPKAWVVAAATCGSILLPVPLNLFGVVGGLATLAVKGAQWITREQAAEMGMTLEEYAEYSAEEAACRRRYMEAENARIDKIHQDACSK
ncbi:hypothetical protein PROFUN_10619 [Planoprotostelium fungivorum]|uniref:Uncharacterized protein n=1 Tax=Planoprotostelium fungivorum TaxID=1890364 RepID=A0A2P6ND88_9EUKA|nr:hypothetical protein PROFUN_10619 [Planoprotostelium fungivorum]